MDLLGHLVAKGPCGAPPLGGPPWEGLPGVYGLLWGPPLDWTYRGYEAPGNKMPQEML